MATELFDEFTCLTCPGEPEFKTRAAAVEHVKSVHSVSGKGRKNLVMHLDFGRGCWQSSYEWDFVKFKLMERTGRRQLCQTVK